MTSMWFTRHSAPDLCFYDSFASVPYIDDNGDFFGIGALVTDPPTEVRVCIQSCQVVQLLGRWKYFGHMHSSTRQTALPSTPEREALNTFFGIGLILDTVQSALCSAWLCGVVHRISAFHSLICSLSLGVPASALTRRSGSCHIYLPPTPSHTTRAFTFTL